jgi:mRNA interferase MazF
MDRALAPGNVALRKGQAGLTRPSVVNVSQIVTVDKTELEERVGQLAPVALEAVLAGVRLVFER